MNIEKQHKVLATYDIKIENVSSSSTTAYTKIRWKTNLEKYIKEVNTNGSM